MFKFAKPIFPKEKNKEMNVFAGFRAEVDSLKNAKITLSAYTFYQLYVNGEFVGYGPARTAKGYARVDVIDLDKYNKDGVNEIVIGVMGYYCRALSTVHQPSFLCAEVSRDGEVVAFTGKDFECYLPACHTQKTERYSVQRHFTEVWDYSGCKTWADAKDVCEYEVVDSLTYIDRVAPYAYYEDVMLDSAVVCGALEYDGSIVPKKSFYSFQPSERWGTYKRDEVGLYFEWVSVISAAMKNCPRPRSSTSRLC